MDFSASNAWGFLCLLAVLLLALLLANMLKRKIPLLRKSLIPTSVLAGLIVLIVSSIYTIATRGEYLFELEFFGAPSKYSSVYSQIAGNEFFADDSMEKQTPINLDEFTHYASYTMHHKQLRDEMYSQQLEEAQRLELRLEENEAQYRILEDIVTNSEGPMLADIEYVYVDMNGDSKAELIVQGKDMTTCHTNIYEFNGTDYKSIYSFNSDGVVKYDFEERKLLTANDAGNTVITVVAWDDELKFIATDSYRESWNHDENIPIYTHNDETISADEFDKALDKYESDEGELEFIPFAPCTKYYEKNYANNNQA